MKSITQRLAKAVLVSGLLLIGFLAMGQTFGVALADNPAHTISGAAMTSDETPRPVVNARIVAKRVNSSQQISATTGADGSYHLSVPLSRSTWQVWAEKSDTTTPAEATAPSGSRLVSFFSNSTPESQQANFTFPLSSSHITGRLLVSGTTTVPDVAVSVTAVQILGAQSAPAQETVVIVTVPMDPATGIFDLTLPPGTYQITFLPSDLLKYLPVVLTGVQVADNQTNSLGDVFLTPLTVPGNFATLSGQVQTTGRDPVAGVRVVGVRTSDRTPTVPATTAADGSFTLIVEEGEWWVAVVLSEEDDYLPYQDKWQTNVAVEAGQTITGVELLLLAADARIQATLTAGENGPQATDACGVAAAYKVGEPSLYNFRTFTGGSFDLPVITGTWRLVILPEPALEQLQSLLPEGCAAGKYLAKSVRSVAVDSPGTVPVTIALESQSATIHSQLWDTGTDAALTGWGGQLFGWNPAKQSWAAAQIDAQTGRGDLRASQGDWLLAYRIDPDSGYNQRPGIARTTVTTGALDVTVPLNVATGAVAVKGRLLDPDGAGVANAVVIALGRAVGSTATASSRTDSSGGFTLTLNSGIYLLEVFGPGAMAGEKAWISPAPQRLTVAEGETSPSPILQFRTGDATIHGKLTTAAPQTAAASPSLGRALVWATSREGRTKTRVAMPMGGNDEYRLPAIQGTEWRVAAAWWDGTTLWFGQERMAVASADVALHLELKPVAAPSGERVTQAIAAGRGFYAELSNGVTLQGSAASFRQESRSAGGKSTLRLERGCLFPAQPEEPLPWTHLCPEDTKNAGRSSHGSQPAEGLRLLSAIYSLSGEDAQGSALTNSVLATPLVLRIPYDAATLDAQGFSPDELFVVYESGNGAGWQSYSSFVVDESSREVVIFAEQWGSYALAGATVYQKLYLPGVMRE